MLRKMMLVCEKDTEKEILNYLKEKSEYFGTDLLSAFTLEEALEKLAGEYIIVYRSNIGREDSVALYLLY